MWTVATEPTSSIREKLQVIPNLEHLARLGIKALRSSNAANADFHDGLVGKLDGWLRAMPDYSKRKY
jgi:hypothetical protein